MDKNKRKKGRSRNNKKVDSHTRINVNKNESIFQVLKGLHITQDLPYRVMKSNIMGRYLVAGKDLAAGELIIEEDPLVIGPSQQCGLVCLGCYCPIQIDTIVR
ncbi:hypothetical protein M8J75_004495 [Diaphorina citri]|nr:hypothetical protein M8J75_004495 [Diaphorina citri]